MLGVVARGIHGSSSGSGTGSSSGGAGRRGLLHDGIGTNPVGGDGGGAAARLLQMEEEMQEEVPAGAAADWEANAEIGLGAGGDVPREDPDLGLAPGDEDVGIRFAPRDEYQDTDDGHGPRGANVDFRIRPGDEDANINIDLGHGEEDSGGGHVSRNARTVTPPWPGDDNANAELGARAKSGRQSGSDGPGERRVQRIDKGGAASSSDPGDSRVRGLDLARSVPGVARVFGRLGSGSFSNVWECEADGFENQVAMKVFKPGNSKQQTRECQLHAALRHPNLVRLLQVVEGPPCAILIELCLGGTLSQVIHEPTSRAAFLAISAHARVRAALDVFSAVEFLHANKVLHRDVKPSNCLLSSRREVCAEYLPQIKLGDLGLARHEADKMSKRVGTLVYMAPELMEDEHYSFPVDVYSCSMLLYEISTGNVPFLKSDQRLQREVALVLVVSMGERPSLDALPRDAAELRPILQAGWHAEPASRPTAAGLAELLRSLPAMA